MIYIILGAAYFRTFVASDTFVASVAFEAYPWDYFLATFLEEPFLLDLDSFLAFLGFVEGFNFFDLLIVPLIFQLIQV